MTPDKRLDQLEPLVADVLQKVDRLIEGQGKLVELVVSTNELAVSTNSLATEAHSLATESHALATESHELSVSNNRLVIGLKAEVDQVKRTGEITANGLANLTNSVQIGFSDIRQQMADMNVDIRQQMADIKTDQNLILQLLREKLP